MTNGLEHSYVGIEPRRRAAPLPPQLDRLEALKRVRGHVDAVMVSVGANDARFGAVVSLCARSGFCPDQKLGSRPAGIEVPDLIERLPDEYARVAPRLAGVVEDPRDVLLTEYFDPLYGTNGRFCHRSLGKASATELRWAEQSLLLPLNDATRAAAARHGWSHVGGIRQSFARHGYCAGRARWIVRVDDSFLKHTGSPAIPRLKGTMHPNASGHEAIAARLAPALANRLGLPPPVLTARAVATDPDAPVERREGPTPWPWILGAVLLALLTGLWLVARGWAKRLSLLVRRSYRPDPVPTTDGPQRQPVPFDERTWTQLLALAAKVLSSVAAGTGIVLVLGATILWVRYSAVGAPGGASVNAAGQQEWLVAGWHALLLFALLGGVAVLLARALDPNAQAGRPTRRGLGVILALELLAAVMLGDFDVVQRVQIASGLVFAALLISILVDRAIPAVRTLYKWWFQDIEAPPESNVGANPADPNDVLSSAKPNEAPKARGPFRRLLEVGWQLLLPLAVLAGAVVIACMAERTDRLFIVPALLTAALLFTGPGGIARNASVGKDHGERSPIEAPRVLLAVTALLCMGILLGRDEFWLLGAAVFACLLAFGCLVVAAVTGRRFAPYAAAVFLSVPLFGAAVASLRAIERPELQPLAALTDDGRAVCGVYVGRSDGRLWYAVLEPRRDVSSSSRTVRAQGRLAAVPDGDGTSVRLGPLQSLPDAQVRAVTLRDELLAERGRPRGGPTCTTQSVPARAQTPREGALRRLADRYTPDLTMFRNDFFPPTSVQTMFAFRDRHRPLCRRVDVTHCLRLAHQGELPWTGGQGQYLDFPAKPSSIKDQRKQLLRALGPDPDGNASTYFLVAGDKGSRSPVSLQYWFFYPFNYQRVELGRGRVTGGYHEGDFETVGVVLSARRRPRYVWMARHDNEGRAFAWNETALETTDDHVRAYVARGSHASYERCGRHRRPVGGGRVDDFAVCDDQDPLRLSPSTATRIDLARVGWACWQGRFGQSAETQTERIPQFVNNGPRSPLWQQDFGGVEARPCDDLPDPGRRQGPAEEILDSAAAARLRRTAGRLTPLIDDCADWERPQLEGVYLVACDEAALDRYVASGLEDAGPEHVRIARPGDPRRTPFADMPAVQRDHDALRPAEWRITAAAPAQRTIFVSCRQGPRTLDASFMDVQLLPGRTYRVDDRGPDVWRLRTADGSIVAQAAPVDNGVPAGAAVDCSIRG